MCLKRQHWFAILLQRHILIVTFCDIPTKLPLIEGKLVSALGKDCNIVCYKNFTEPFFITQGKSS